MKKQGIKLIALILAMLMLMMCFAACNNEEPEADGSTDTEADTSADTGADSDNGTSSSKKDDEDEGEGLKTFYGMPKYETAKGKMTTINCGPGLMADNAEKGTSEDVYMLNITGTTRKEFGNYIKKIKHELIDERTDNAGMYYTFKSEQGRYFYVSLSVNDGKVSIIQDNANTTSPKELSTGEANKGDISFYQYGLDYSGGRIWGMMYIVKFPDNSLMLIDGGHRQHWNDTSMKDNFMSFLRDITGTAATEKVHIRAWMFTHAHGDHVGITDVFLKAHSKDVVIDAAMFNFPSLTVTGTDGSDWYSSRADDMKNAFVSYSPDTKFIKLHRGQQFNFFGATFDIMYTWEDIVSGDTISMSDYNNTSTVMKMTFNGKSVMILGDINKAANNAIQRNYTAADLKSDAVSIAHHGYNDIDIYTSIKASIGLVSNAENTSPTHGRDRVENEGGILYFANKQTYELVFYADGRDIKVNKL